MKTDFILPDIGEGIVECELVEWHVQPGQAIEEDQPVADVMTDKALVEITAMHTGTISQLYWAQGETARVGQPLFEIEVDADHEETTETVTQGDALNAESSSSNSANPCSESTTSDHNTSATTVSRPGKALASPAVRRIARERSLDLSLIQGSGKDGRVLKEDLLKEDLLNDQSNHQGDVSSSSHQTADNMPAVGTSHQPGSDRTEPIKGVRAAMARQMEEAVKCIPHFTYSDEVDITTLDQLRQQLKQEIEVEGIKLSLLPFMMKALALAIQAYPILNSRVNDDCTTLTYLNDVNIGMAADTPMGLMVPNIKQVQHKSLREIAAEVTQLTEQARAGRLPPDSMKQGTISISNIGALGGTTATPIINKPEVAIVALGRMQSLPRFNNQGDVEARKIIQISWSGDHRIIDGATMARFSNLWKSYLEQPVTMLTELR
ncbi:dihydrolipoamide acetyltransferase [Terasakiispira papahanaumokuakeensis]|uniref:Dihydrolipoamide acetyltransferase component of pyruvate dehydrogenase complex n=1 Tax=Terasakiispira papahanaumokuakeensis TaxID=197479 RepID=A0A1E2V9K7_9GAMM|nr:2-oxo acid dehydrogenase subunit E2 [Terasakiispira papahanaumokuakeensis]ODC03671.1 dihydrolipoamide acetyltransferase [Terasakiispira papahanaumokuakeensis]